jgi:hypothetical protein
MVSALSMHHSRDHPQPEALAQLERRLHIAQARCSAASADPARGKGIGDASGVLNHFDNVQPQALA